MLVGAYGLFWDRELVAWTSRGWRLLGRRGFNAGTVRVADFRPGRGVYVLYSNTGIYYVGLASGRGGIGGRLHDHLTDEHAERWTRFSWFAFDSPEETSVDADGVLRMEEWASLEEAEDKLLIREMEALLLAATAPPGNVRRTAFQEGEQWLQVAERTMDVRSFGELAPRLTPGDTSGSR